MKIKTDLNMDVSYVDVSYDRFAISPNSILPKEIGQHIASFCSEFKELAKMSPSVNLGKRILVIVIRNGRMQQGFLSIVLSVSTLANFQSLLTCSIKGFTIFSSQQGHTKGFLPNCHA